MKVLDSETDDNFTISLWQGEGHESYFMIGLSNAGVFDPAACLVLSDTETDITAIVLYDDAVAWIRSDYFANMMSDMDPKSAPTWNNIASSYENFSLDGEREIAIEADKNAALCLQTLPTYGMF